MHQSTDLRRQKHLGNAVMQGHGAVEGQRELYAEPRAEPEERAQVHPTMGEVLGLAGLAKMALLLIHQP
jgi:hypothetical protein